MKIRLKRLCTLITEVESNEPRPYVALEHIGNNTGQLLLEAELEVLDAPGPGMATSQPGDVLFGKLRPYLAKTWSPEISVYASTELLCLRPNSRAYNDWYKWLMSSQPVIEWGVATSEGTKMPRTSWEKLSALEVAVPPPSTQRAIADFLDTETARIDALIEKKQRLSELLLERRQTLISETVTKGAPGAAAGGDGVNRTVKLKHVTSVVAGQSPPSNQVADFEELGLPFLQGNAEFGTSNPKPRYRCDSAQKSCAQGAILLSVRAPVGALNIADREYGIGRGLCAIQPSKINEKFFWWVVNASIAELLSMAVGSTYDAVTTEDVGNVRIPHPDDPTQRAIADFLDAETAKIDTLRTRINNQLELLKEHRQALVTAAVTDQLDIPGVPA